MYKERGVQRDSMKGVYRMGRNNVMAPPISTPDFILKIKGGVHTILDEKSHKAKYHVKTQKDIYKQKFAARVTDIRLEYKARIDPINESKSELENKLQEENNSRNPEIRAHAVITENEIHKLDVSVKKLEEKMEMVIKRARQNYNQKISAYLHHTSLNEEVLDNEA